MDFRIAVVTPLFPLRDEPYRGMAIYNTVLELRKLVITEVFCPVAEYPNWKVLQPSKFVYRKPDRDYQPAAVPTHYIGYPALPLLSRPLNGWTCAARLLPALRDFRPDLILAYWLYPEGRGALLAGRKLGVPVVGGSRGSDLRLPPDRISHYLLRRTIRGMQGILTVSEELRLRAIAMGAAPDHVRTIVNGCDQQMFQPLDASEARQRLRLDPDAEWVVFIGQIKAKKGLPELAEAFIQLAPRRPRLRIAIVGEGGWRDELEARLSAHGLTGRVRLPGACAPSQVADWMAAADVFCLPSHSEGCPNVVLEALACGRPVVATTVGAIPEFVDESCGILVPPGDATALARCAQRSTGPVLGQGSDIRPTPAGVESSRS
jgi:teichuronic acid biosynthesis glycosyltransferase TuaC